MKQLVILLACLIFSSISTACTPPLDVDLLDLYNLGITNSDQIFIGQTSTGSVLLDMETENIYDYNISYSAHSLKIEDSTSYKIQSYIQKYHNTTDWSPYYKWVVMESNSIIKQEIVSEGSVTFYSPKLNSVFLILENGTTHRFNIENYQINKFQIDNWTPLDISMLYKLHPCDSLFRTRFIFYNDNLGIFKVLNQNTQYYTFSETEINFITQDNSNSIIVINSLYLINLDREKRILYHYNIQTKEYGVWEIRDSDIHLNTTTIIDDYLGLVIIVLILAIVRLRLKKKG
ncbi:MAG: hypothetical protein INQ03_20050 [Candidatus Heimdallarchaeota archaeon]|nr:hypothetical protein [Candidatus Heimdallarchaeota archaeon]